MPRFSTGKTIVSTKEKARRARSYQVRAGSGFLDPFPNVHGTLPEKIVYAALSRRGIPFLFLNNVKIAIPEIELFKVYQADFVMPGLNLIIEVQGARWHATPEAIESDALKFALYQQAGYKVLGWWDYEIISNVNLLFAAEPLLAGYQATRTVSSELPVVERTKVDTSKGIRTLNKRRAARLLYKKTIRVR